MAENNIVDEGTLDHAKGWEYSIIKGEEPDEIVYRIHPEEEDRLQLSLKDVGKTFKFIVGDEKSEFGQECYPAKTVKNGSLQLKVDQ